MLYEIVVGFKIGAAKGNEGLSANMSSGTSSNTGLSAGTRRVTVMCVSIALCFTLVSGPSEFFNFVVAAGYYNVPAALSDIFVTLRTTNACIDAVIYGLMWRPIRKTLVEVRIKRFIGQLVTNIITRYYCSASREFVR